jgi:hypothetical protein
MRRNLKRHRNAAWDAGLAFCARRRPTQIDIELWALLNLRDVFLAAHREGRCSERRMVQARLPFPPAA